MSTAPIVSVVIPAYNHERFVAGAIGSVLGQSFADFELIVADDASSDSTWDVVAGFSDPRIRATRHAINLGAHATLNEGIATARGKYIAILNSDDLFAPKRLDVMVTKAREAASAEIFAFSDVDFIDADGVAAPAHPRAAAQARLRERCLPCPPALWFLTGNPAISTSNYFFSKSVFDATGPFAPLRYTHDWDWALRAAQRCEPTWVHEALLSYRVHETNTLAEDDSWRHVHENSLVQAAALIGLGMHPPGVPQTFTPHDVCLALLRNESLHPVSLLCLLVSHLAGAGEPALRALSTKHDGLWPLSSMALAAGYPEYLFGPAPRLIEMIDALAGQATLIEQRWTAMQQMSAEIDSRDRWIVDLQERLAAMEGAVAERDRQIASMREQIDANLDALRISNDRLAAMHASRLVRVALYMGRVLRRIGMRREDPRLR